MVLGCSGNSREEEEIQRKREEEYIRSLNCQDFQDTWTYNLASRHRLEMQPWEEGSEQREMEESGSANHLVFQWGRRIQSLYFSCFDLSVSQELIKKTNVLVSIMSNRRARSRPFTSQLENFQYFGFIQMEASLNTTGLDYYWCWMGILRCFLNSSNSWIHRLEVVMRFSAFPSNVIPASNYVVPNESAMN